MLKIKAVKNNTGMMLAGLATPQTRSQAVARIANCTASQQTL